MDPMPAIAEPGWQPLPPRARLLLMLEMLPIFAVPAVVAGITLSVLTDRLHPALGGVLAFALATVFAAWRGTRQYRYLGWMLDEDGLAVRRGSLWQRDTRVPATRVQHLDVRRGPLQRRRGLATLVLHTAGSRLNTVTVPHLDDADAERLRDTLSRRIRDVDD